MNERAIILRNAKELILAEGTAKQAGQQLLTLNVNERAIVVSLAFGEALDKVKPADADDAAEKFGRRIEAVLDEMPTDEFKATLAGLIGAGDTELVLKMVAGRAGEFSSTAEHLTVELVAEFFDRDPDLRREEDFNSRLITAAWTFLMETPVNCPGVNNFFLQTEKGREYADKLASLAFEGEEDAKQITANLRERAEYHSEEKLEEEENEK